MSETIPLMLLSSAGTILCRSVGQGEACDIAGSTKEK